METPLTQVAASPTPTPASAPSADPRRILSYPPLTMYLHSEQSPFFFSPDLFSCSHFGFYEVYSLHSSQWDPFKMKSNPVPSLNNPSSGLPSSLE